MTGKQHDCKHGFDQADAVFVKNLRSSTESLVRTVFKAFIGLIGIGLVILFFIGVVVVGFQAWHKMGFGG